MAAQTGDPGRRDVSDASRRAAKKVIARITRGGESRIAISLDEARAVINLIEAARQQRRPKMNTRVAGALSGFTSTRWSQITGLTKRTPAGNVIQVKPETLARMARVVGLRQEDVEPYSKTVANMLGGLGSPVAQPEKLSYDQAKLLFQELQAVTDESTLRQILIDSGLVPPSDKPPEDQAS